MIVASRISRTTLLSALLIAGLSSAAAAQSTNSGTTGTDTPRIDAREARQDQRVYRGVQNGSLTPNEYQRLERRDGRIEAAEARAKADGVVTPAERAHLNGMLDRQSGAIYRQRHDAQGTGGTGTPRIDARERQQQGRIYAGARDGSLTPTEFRRLEAGQYRIRAAEARARADGTVTAGERARVGGMLNHQSHAIYRQRHDGQRR